MSSFVFTRTSVFLIFCIQLSQAFCPYLNIPLSVAGVEDEALSLFDRWQAALLATGIQTPPGLYHSGCTNCQNPACVKRFVEWTNPDLVKTTVRLEYGQMWLSGGFPVCGATLETAFYEPTEEERTVLSLISDVQTLNCKNPHDWAVWCPALTLRVPPPGLLKYVMFAGTANANRNTHLASLGSQPTISVTVTPVCSTVPSQCVGASSPTVKCAPNPLDCSNAGGVCTSCSCPPARIDGAYCGASFQVSYHPVPLLRLARDEKSMRYAIAME